MTIERTIAKVEKDAEERVKKVRLLFSLGMSVAKISEQTGFTEIVVLRLTQQS